MVRFEKECSTATFSPEETLKGGRIRTENLKNVFRRSGEDDGWRRITFSYGNGDEYNWTNYKTDTRGKKYRRIGRDDDGNEKHLTEFQTHNGMNMDDRR